MNGDTESHDAPGTIFAQVGEDALHRLVAGFYARVPGDDVLGPMYPPADLAGAEERLRDFLVYRFGGPQRYIARRGHPRLRMRHAPFAIDARARERWMELMGASLDASGIVVGPREAIRAFLADVATFLINR